MLTAIAWRNLGRNRRRTTLTATAIAFSVAIMVFALSMQSGQYAVMAENIVRMGTGHAQIQTPDYLDNPDVRKTIDGLGPLLARLRAAPGIRAALPRATAFALVSTGERTAGAQVIAVDPTAEIAAMALPSQIADGGRYLLTKTASEAVVGIDLATNLGLAVGGELVVLGTGKESSVAALALTVVGLVDSGVPELDRTLVHVPLTVFQEAFELHDEANSIIILGTGIDTVTSLVETLADVAPANLSVLRWDEIRPELTSLMEIKRLGGYFFFLLLGVMVTFSIVNTFIMTVYERTPEFGMLMAVGLTPASLQRLLQLESVMLCGGGVLLGALLATALVVSLSHVGIPLPDTASDIVRRYQMPPRLYPAFAPASLLWPCILMFAGTQIAAYLPGLRIRRLNPVEALRAI
ncbi:MAG: ABC transporter permease [Pseudomonadales bacterium]|nr:ABC transporter permease [Pseudomonadales bacterium]MCP5182376.1 ABC transporter permease [Pseudomonadales bacterium]